MTVDLTSARWRKSSYSGTDGGACVEVADGQFIDTVPLRDSKDPEGPALLLPLTAFTAFVAGIKAGDFGTVCPLP
ncbi:hypothetical protein P3T37_005571 [Kitasatospora sp. MAA4]|uniref:DUF397 domain-containing protein n=1 Tax=Kitasatospora sp. MAA4 TaxID=3035093 RepID=UPI0024738E77|nr:DUF397 domain-containing protein [Kitasatospora sp. MAA4]MDH6136152.1 hypothetical protein [Kitasatospora sp. MAA4]